MHNRYNRYFAAKNREDLIQKVTNYELANGHDPTEDLEGDIEDWLCGQPGMERRCLAIVNRARSVMEYAAGGIAHLKAKVMGERAFVDEQTAARRAKVCLNCPKNTINAKDSRLQLYTDQAMLKDIGERKTPHDKLLYTCEICSCILRAKVHFSREIVLGSISNRVRLRLPNGKIRGKDGKPLTCWQLVEPRE